VFFKRAALIGLTALPQLVNKIVVVAANKRGFNIFIVI